MLVFTLLALQVTWGFSPARYLQPGFYYIHQVYGTMVETVAAIKNSFRSRDRLLLRLEELEKKEAQLELVKKKMSLIRAENKRLRGHLGLPQSPAGHLVSTEVLNRNLGGWERTAVLNRGYGSGLQPGYPVLENQGDSWILRGKIDSVKKQSSNVILVDDPRFKIGVEIEGVPARQFVLRGKGYDRLVITDFPQIISVAEGARVKTATSSSIAPPGLIVGQVKASENKSTIGPGKNLIVSPRAYRDFPGLLWVLRTND